MNCEICKKPLDYNEDESAYCSECTNIDGSVFQILSYFLVPISSDAIPSFDKDNFRWPDVRDPAVWHERACKLFPDWRDTVNAFKRLKSIKYFDMKSFREYIEYAMLKTSEKSYEELMITQRSKILDFINADLARLVTQKEAADPIILVNQNDQIKLLPDIS